VAIITSWAVGVDTTANRPAAATAGRLYYATDSGLLWYDTGSAWRIIMGDFALEAARGNVSGVAAVNIFGHAPTGVQTTATDIWDRADASPTQQIWVAPTTARVHAIVSSSVSDDGAPPGVGAQTIRVHGLTAWNTAETSEDITMDGTTNVNTANSYVIIHKMSVLTKGATNINVGTITATAATDATITAAILPGQGETHMAIYGVSSLHTAYIARRYAAVYEASAPRVSCSLLVNPTPTTELLNFKTVHRFGLDAGATSSFTFAYNPYFKIAGPAILKTQGISSAVDTDTTTGIDLYLVTN
jgi:hypothetical protein